MLKKEEIIRIQKYVSTYYTEYLDVELEVIDHLASIVEEKQRLSPERGFTINLNEAFREFPSSQFNKIIAEKEKSMEKYWKKRFNAYLIDFISWPKILVLILLSMINYLVLGFDDLIMVGLFTLLILFSLIAAFFQGYLGLPSVRKEESKFLSIKSFQKLSSSTLLGNMFFYMQIPNLLEWKFFQQFHGAVILSIIISITLLIYYAFLWHFPKMIKEEILDKHQESLIAYN